MSLKSKFIFILSFFLIPVISFAQNVGQCGWGSKLFDGQGGIFPQVLAVTTNGTSGNQTFAISSGTSGCTQNGVVRSSWRTAVFIDSNMNKLARDMSRGEGEAIDSLAEVMEVQKEDQESFKLVLKENFDKIFSEDSVTSEQVLASINSTIKKHPELNKYTV